MDFKRVRETAFVDDEPIDVEFEDVPTAKDVLHQMGEDPSNKSLVQHTPSGKPMVLKPDDPIRLANGNKFSLEVRTIGGLLIN